MTETFIKKGDESNLHLTNYCLGAHYSRNSKRGGSCILVRNNLAFKKVPLSDFYSENAFEFCGIQILNYVIICIYRTPSSDVKVFFNKLQLLLQKYVINKNMNVILTGDLNINMMLINKYSDELRDILCNFNLFLHINEPTRQSACLDLFISNVPGAIGEIHRLGLSDHDTGQTLTFKLEQLTEIRDFVYIFKRDYHEDYVI